MKKIKTNETVNNNKNPKRFFLSSYLFDTCILTFITLLESRHFFVKEAQIKMFNKLI